MRVALFLTFWIVLSLGVAGALVGVGLGMTTPSDPNASTSSGQHAELVLQSGVALVVAAVAALATISGIQSWRDERVRSRTERSRETYAGLVRNIMRRHASDPSWSIVEEGTLRADVSTWGSGAVVEALGNWSSIFDQGLANGKVDGDGTLTLQPDDAAALKSGLAKLIIAIRAELGADVIDANAITAALFNQSRTSST